MGAIRHRDRLITTRDIDIDGGTIPAGKVLWAFKPHKERCHPRNWLENEYEHDKILPVVAVYGFGPHPVPGIQVVDSLKHGDNETPFFLPLDCIKVL